MKAKQLFFAALMTIASAAAVAQSSDFKSGQTDVPTFRTWAPTAPMGWNSWDCYYSTVTEPLVLQNAEYMRDHLLEYGWEYVVVDIRWYANHPSLGGGWYNQSDKPAECQLDEYGRYVPSPTRFPSVMVNGKNEGFKALADKIHQMGLKFGIHIMRGVPKYILDNPDQYKLKGAEDVAWSKVYKSKTPECAWLQDNLTVKNNEYGQLYYNSIADLYAEWGVDFIKVDDMSRPYYKNEIEMLRRANDQTGRPIILSLSPGKTDYAQIDHLHQTANQWRMMDDLWDRWDDVKAVFKEAAYWAQHHVQGCYADCDMLPLGRISMTVRDPGYCNADNGRKTKLTKDEQLTLMSLWGICHSPLMFGGELTKNDDFTNSLLTNRDYLRMHHEGQNAREVSNDHGQIIWTSEVGADRYLALFYADAGNGWILDEQALYGSGTVAYTTDGHKVDVDISLPAGTTELALVIDDAGDGNDYDHGDWLNPVFLMQDGTERPITGADIKDKYTNSYYNTINENQNVTATGKMRVLGKEYDRGFSADANAMILFNVPEGAVGFRGTGALDDSGIGQPGANSRTSIRFYVFNFDPRLEKNSTSASIPVSCDLTQFGYDTDDQLTIHDVWSGEQLLTMQPGVLTQDVNRHGVRLLRIVSAKQQATGIQPAVRRPFDRAIQGTYTLDGRRVADSATLPKGVYVVGGRKIVK